MLYDAPKCFSCFSLHALVIFWSVLFIILCHLSPVILANATAVAFVLLCSSMFSFHCYTQCEAMPTQKLVWRKWQLRCYMTSWMKDYKGHSLMNATSFTEPPSSTPQQWSNESTCHGFDSQCPSQGRDHFSVLPIPSQHVHTHSVTGACLAFVCSVHTRIVGHIKDPIFIFW